MVVFPFFRHSPPPPSITVIRSSCQFIVQNVLTLFRRRRHPPVHGFWAWQELFAKCFTAMNVYKMFTVMENENAFVTE